MFFESASEMLDHLLTSICLPVDADRAMLVGRVWLHDVGPVLVCVKPDGVYDLSPEAATMSELLEMEDPGGAVRQHGIKRIGDTQAVLRNSSQDERNPALPWFLAPSDLQALKAAGVTFVSSMLKRVIEEQARGDASKAESVRQAVVAVIGDNLSRIKPGSEEAARLRGGGPAQASTAGARCMVAVPGSRHWPRCRDFHQIAADECRGCWGGSRHPSAQPLE